MTRYKTVLFEENKCYKIVDTQNVAGKPQWIATAYNEGDARNICCALNDGHLRGSAASVRSIQRQSRSYAVNAAS